MRVERVEESHRIVDAPSADGDLANAYLCHLEVRAFAPLTVRAYAFHVLSFLRFCADRGLALATVSPMDVFDFLEWLASGPSSSGRTVVALKTRRGAAAPTMNQRVAAVRGLFEFAVISGVRDDCPV